MAPRIVNGALMVKRGDGGLDAGRFQKLPQFLGIPAHGLARPVPLLQHLAIGGLGGEWRVVRGRARGAVCGQSGLRQRFGCLLGSQRSERKSQVDIRLRGLNQVAKQEGAVNGIPGRRQQCPARAPQCAFIWLVADSLRYKGQQLRNVGSERLDDRRNFRVHEVACRQLDEDRTLVLYSPLRPRAQAEPPCRREQRPYSPAAAGPRRRRESAGRSHQLRLALVSWKYHFNGVRCAT